MKEVEGITYKGVIMMEGIWGQVASRSWVMGRCLGLIGAPADHVSKRGVV